ncbi:unnamed protein product [Rotaria sp. Silwood2]|nr:unnamed protein product [Rotaria sp. Silwood2]CAF2943103.1 unnamed protein product [Rotaria sp. Silwood2]CAF3331739.1 unnamed protein product [Rotaria sp. Silwood2]CAF4362829.1 unnamed protein product [Rotaria sp. Silwood2]CAF4365693.1 unnamed protein product [Rotaria sp. Silwood2]
MPISYHFDSLPLNVLTLSGYEFFQFIKTILGESEAKLLIKIAVRTTSSLITIEDPLDIFNQDIEDEELDTLKEQLCFKMKKDKYLIKPGLKHPKKNKQQQSNLNVSSISSLELPVQEKRISSLSLSDHKTHVLKLINKRCNENKENLNLQNFQLEEDIDFTLNIDVDQNSDVKASIKCKCGKIIALCNNDKKIQMSNYYKHLQSIGCTHMREIKKAAKEIIVEQQQPSTISVSSIPSSQSRTSSMEVYVDELIGTQTAPQIVSASSSQLSHTAKRRMTSQSQQYPSTKRSRT